jgi:single-strand DNA-binding protein
MAGSVNKVILIGNVGRDPEIRSTQDGMRICNLSIATSENWRDKASGERKEKTEWHRVAVFNDRLVEVIERYVKKGAKLYIEGTLQTRKWTDKDNQERYTTEVVLGRFNGQLTMLDGRSGGEGFSDMPDESPAPRASTPRSGGGGGGGSSRAPVSHDLDDEIPF